MSFTCCACHVGTDLYDRHKGDRYIEYLRLYTCANCVLAEDTCVVCERTHMGMDDDVCEDCLELALELFEKENPGADWTDETLTDFAKEHKKVIKETIVS